MISVVPSPEVEIVKYASGADTLTVSVDFKQLKVALDVTGDYAAKLPSYEETGFFDRQVTRDALDQ